MSQPAPEAELWWGTARIGTVQELSADMYWFRARWSCTPGPTADAFLAEVEAGEDPEVILVHPDGTRRRLRVTSATREELELKPPT